MPTLANIAQGWATRRRSLRQSQDDPRPLEQRAGAGVAPAGQRATWPHDLLHDYGDQTLDVDENRGHRTV